ncbi:hypothetical protein [Cohnella sp. REN36]|uniref:hypothetical protein n=1 Tax=Cohnella sp. REN36 TaxID=2887347 RepID=UPI001D133A09|nr:hypothetical protein [Cohnella sp. REN36]MCC3375472.1 hypothetical protein [Cohnella sp. REN36]
MNALNHAYVWFNVVTLLAAYGLALRLPRAMPGSIAALVMIFSLTAAKGLDDTIGMKPYDWYDINVSSSIDFWDLVTWMIYPPVGYLFVYLFHVCRIRGLSIPVFLLLSALIGTGFEWLATVCGVFHYKGWSLRYSFLMYLVVQAATLAFFVVLKRQYHRTKAMR